ncbi:Hypothetical_protein [Hexamita inflata]|uniref:Hypothetical_protein n=1 Tax=Hexamita inflata TaxID=28002 RepID=A0AA86V334_9EUKA|nr:Hypothetical protein HINF_LOCUS62012 [Hexamita inflata]
MLTSMLEETLLEPNRERKMNLNTERWYFCIEQYSKQCHSTETYYHLKVISATYIDFPSHAPKIKIMTSAQVSKLSYLYKFLTPEIQFAIKQATITCLKEKLHCGYERFNKGEFECLIASFIVMMCAPQPNLQSYFGSTEFFSYPFIQEMFSNYDIKTYLSCLSFYERMVKDDEDSEEESNSEQESEDEILSEPDENEQQ